VVSQISHINSGINIDMHQISNGLVNESTEISLKIILGIGQTNKWEVKWVGVLDELSGEMASSQHQVQVAAKLNKSYLKTTRLSTRTDLPVKPNQFQLIAFKAALIKTRVWRPRVSGPQSL
jgi:hypothetical protein